ncbi:MAG: response regulator [Chloroflexi bacterium]|nr:response regulator [Chloroflexota bacterium]
MARVLIVDDEPSVRESLVRIAEAEGLEAIEAEDGAAALDLVKMQMPDVILLDNVMPKLDGIGFLKVLRADTAVKQPPVIMVTAHGTPDERRAAIELGVVDYITKPWAPGQIELRLKWVLKAGSTVPAAPWELSGAESAEHEDDLELQAGEGQDDQKSAESDEWSSLDLPEGSGTDVVTPEEGGWLETKDGRVRVTLPAGAVRRAMALSASPVDANEKLNGASLRLRIGSVATDLTFSDGTGSPIEGVELDRPVEITLKLDPETAENADDPLRLQVQEMDGRTGEWSDLPTRVDLKNGVARVRKVEFPPPEYQRKGATVLVISDEESEQKALCESLDSAGYDTLIESNPDDVIQTLIAERPDVVLLDIAMRRLGGISILRQIKGDPQTRQVAVITLGQPPNAEDEDKSRSDYAQSMALGARDMIAKPWHPGDLQARVARAVDASRARTRQAERAVERAKTRLEASRRNAAPPARRRRQRLPVR